LNCLSVDAEIADHLRTVLITRKGTGLWVLVQRRWILIQGCVDGTSNATKPPPYRAIGN